MGEEPLACLPDASYSKAFDNLVHGEADLVGLLAYALYKRGIREEAERGGTAGSGSRNPPPTVVEAYRQAAEQRLAEAIEAAIEAVRPDIQGSAFTSTVERVSAELRDHITARTDFRSALYINILAWIVTLALSALIVWTFGRPDALSTLLDRSPPPPAPATQQVPR